MLFFVTGDATRFAVPAAVTVIFLFNPFVGDVQRAVQEQIRRSLVESPRRIMILYVNPSTDEDAFADCDWSNASSPFRPACGLRHVSQFTRSVR